MREKSNQERVEGAHRITAHEIGCADAWRKGQDGRRRVLLVAILTDLQGNNGYVEGEITIESEGCLFTARLFGGLWWEELSSSWERKRGESARQPADVWCWWVREGKDGRKRYLTGAWG